MPRFYAVVVGLIGSTILSVSCQSSGNSILASIPAYSDNIESKLLPETNSIGLFLEKSYVLAPKPLVVTKMPLAAPSLIIVPNRSRTALTPTVFL